MQYLSDLSEELGQAIAAKITAAINEGMQPPIYSVSIGSNGSIIGCHYLPSDGPGLDCRIVVEHIEAGGLRCPIRTFFCDGYGKTGSFVINVRQHPVN